MTFIEKEMEISDKIRILSDWVPSSHHIISQSTKSFIDVSYIIKVCPLKYFRFFQILRPILKIQLIVNPGFFHSNIVERFGIVIGKFHFPNTVEEEQNPQNATFHAPAISANSLNNRKFLHLECT